MGIVSESWLSVLVETFLTNAPALVERRAGESAIANFFILSILDEVSFTNLYHRLANALGGDLGHRWNF